MVTTASYAHNEPSSANAEELARSIHDMILSVIRELHPTVEAEHISKGQFLAMHVLSSLEAASVGTVARQLAVKAPTMCVTVDQLEAAGLVTRRRSVRDHRTVEVSLTPKGRRVEARVWAGVARRIAGAAKGLPPADLAATVRIFRELNRRLDSSKAGPGESK
ncbi:MAG: MarR family transcriptional regulator [Thaumarchaeota archaeon]|nr:MarR family transcriptional regulator [Nitrososphaerota archaeon]